MSRVKCEKARYNRNTMEEAKKLITELQGLQMELINCNVDKRRMQVIEARLRVIGKTLARMGVL
jgi:hypothetical protein